MEGAQINSLVHYGILPAIRYMLAYVSITKCPFVRRSNFHVAVARVTDTDSRRVSLELCFTSNLKQSSNS